MVNRSKFSTVSHAGGVLIAPGDWYYAFRNVAPLILQCESVSDRGWVMPVTQHYPYDTWECYRAIDQRDPTLAEAAKQSHETYLLAARNILNGDDHA